MKLKEFLIKVFGGYTLEEYDDKSIYTLKETPKKTGIIKIQIPQSASKGDTFEIKGLNI